MRYIIRLVNTEQTKSRNKTIRTEKDFETIWNELMKTAIEVC